MSIQSETLNVLFSADDNYAQHLGAAVYSLLAANTEFRKINVFVVDNEIRQENKNRLFDIINKYDNAEIILLDYSKLKDSLNLKMQWQISVSAYARLFISEIMPKEVKKILYLDCDIIVRDSLFDLWNTDLEGNVLAAVQDAVNDEIKGSVGVLPEQQYFNSGLLLIDFEEWNRQNIGEKCFDFIKEKNGSVTHHDQGVLNGVLINNWKRVALKYNLMTIHYVFNLKQIEKYYQDHSVFYTEDEIEKAKTKPAIIHYTPSFTTRPWIGNCKHPLKQYYWDAVSHTPWKDAKPQSDTSKWYVRLINWRYRNKVFI